jgi:hypothetical protein
LYAVLGSKVRYEIDARRVIVVDQSDPEPVAGEVVLLQLDAGAMPAFCSAKAEHRVPACVRDRVTTSAWSFLPSTSGVDLDCLEAGALQADLRRSIMACMPGASDGIPRCNTHRPYWHYLELDSTNRDAWRA